MVIPSKVLEELDERAMMKIMQEPRNSLVKQYRELFALDNVGFEITDGAVREIARSAMKSGTGARGLRSQFEKILMNVMYEIPSAENLDKVIVDHDVVKSGTDPVLVYLDKEKFG